jgi:hypothetical protein
MRLTTLLKYIIFLSSEKGVQAQQMSYELVVLFLFAITVEGGPRK